MISTLPCLKTPTQEYVVPRSIPMTVPNGSASPSAACAQPTATIAITAKALIIFAKLPVVTVIKFLDAASKCFVK